MTLVASPQTLQGPVKFDLLLLKRAQGLGVQRYEGCYGNYFSDPTNQQNMKNP